MTEIEKETGMTDAECEYWDEYITKNPVHLGPDLAKLGIKPGFAHNDVIVNSPSPSLATQACCACYRKHRT